jgi:hypothetical protein
LTTVLALIAEGAAWLAGGANHTESFAWFRIQAHLGAGGLALATLAGLALAALRVRRWPPPWLAALVLHLALFLDLPQAQPDAATWFTLAQHVARAPLDTLTHWSTVAWSGDEARFHKPFPLVPAVYGLAFRTFGESPATADGVLTLWAVALAAVVPWAMRAVGPPGPRRERTARLAGWLVVALPILQAQSGWLLADLPLCVAVTFAWGVLLRARGRWGLVLGLVAGLPAVATKVSGAAFVGAAALALALPLPAFAGALLVVTGALFGVRPPRLHGYGHYLAGALAVGLHLRPGAWVPALAGMRRRRPHRRPLDRLDRLVLGALATVPGLLAWTPVEHVARYSLPVGIALALATARSAPRVAHFLVGSGLVLLVGGYRPILVNNQAVNLQLATRELVAAGVDAIEVRADAPGTTFPPAALAALVDFYAPVPVRTGPALALAPPDTKRHWWEFVAAPPWRAPGPADGLLLCMYGADATEFEKNNPGYARIDTVSRFRASSLLLPREVALYRRSR